MGFFETLMNLDVELSCLATKAFVAKEEFVDKVCYPVPKSKKEEKKSEGESTEKVKSESTETEVTNLEVNDSYKELKALMDEAIEVIGDGDTQIIKQLDAGIKQSIEDLKLYIERARQEKEKQQKLQEDPNAINPLLVATGGQPLQSPPIMVQPHPNQQPVVVGMDFSSLQAGVQYDPHQNQGGPRVPTQEDLDEAFARAAAQQQTQQQAQQPKPQQQKPKK